MDSFNEALDLVGIEIEDIEETNKKLTNEACDGEEDKHIDKDIQHKIFYGLSPEDRKLAVKMQIVPKAYENATFDIEKIRSNIKEYNYNAKLKRFNKYTKGFASYEAICNGILSSIRMNVIPTRSYIIGAPNGFGKTSFVNECLITLLKHGHRVVPYISLYELDEIRKEGEIEDIRRLAEEKYKFLVSTNVGNYERLLVDKKALADTKFDEEKTDKKEYVLGSEYVKKLKSVERYFTYNDYINADCLFVKLSAQQSKEKESNALYQLLSIRSDKGLPTIVMVSYSLDIYKKDERLRNYVWDEILTKVEKENCYDRLYHVSCYYDTNKSNIENKGADIDMQTGIMAK